MRLRSTLFALLMATAIHGQDGPDYTFWSSLEEERKVAFVQGYYTGLARGMSSMRARTISTLR